MIYAVASDNTEPRRGEEQLKALAVNMEKAKQSEEQIETGLATVVNQLRAASSDSEEAARSNGEFPASMSHDLTTSSV